MKFMLMLLISTLGFAQAAAQEQKEVCDPHTDYADIGGKLVANEDYESAVQAYSCAIQLNPEDAFQYLSRANVYINLHDYDDAIADLNESDQLADTSLNAITQFLFGVVYDGRKEYEQALHYFDKAIKLQQQPEFSQGYLYRGFEYGNLGKYETAILDFNHVLEIEPDYANAYFYRASAYVNLGQFDKAIADFDRSFALEPAYRDQNMAFGSLQMEAAKYGRLVARLRTIDLALQYNPLNPDLYRNRGAAYNAVKQYDKAIADLTQAIEWNPGDGFAYYVRGSAQTISQNYDAALADFDRAAELTPNGFYIYVSRGTLHYSLNNYAQTIADYTRFFELYHGLPQRIFSSGAVVFDYLYAYRGNAYALIGDASHAAADYFRFASREEAQPIDAGSLTIGQFSKVSMSDGKVFQFTFDGVAGQHLKLSTAAYFHVEMDTLIIVLSPDGTPLAANDDHVSGLDLSAVIDDFEVPEDGRYTLLVTHANGFRKGSVRVLIEDLASHTP